MTVEELHEVIMREFGHVKDRLDKQNGRIDRAEFDINFIRRSLAYLAGGGTVLGGVIGWLLRD